MRSHMSLVPSSLCRSTSCPLMLMAPLVERIQRNTPLNTSAAPRAPCCPIPASRLFHSPGVRFCEMIPCSA